MTEANGSVVVAVMNEKGGVGKSTTSLNLAAALAEVGERVLLVDLDPQGGVTKVLGVDPAKIERSVYDTLIGPGTTGRRSITPGPARPEAWFFGGPGASTAHSTGVRAQPGPQGA